MSIENRTAVADEHPIETARRALNEAATIEMGTLAVLYTQLANALPRRYGPAPKVPNNVVQLVRR
jgi:hypothetical protein